MRKKLQVFISSTFTDLQEERQAAVQSVLNSGHIPAGMELFKSGDKTQKETIKRWIDESDVYMLILGGRYGAIDDETGKSYTHWEYDYAGEKGKPRFAVVITDEAIKEKGKLNLDFVERDNYPKYQVFRKDVLGKISKFFDDIKDIKLTVMESLKEFESDTTLSGWVSGKDVPDIRETLEENSKLLKEIAKLKSENEKLKELKQKSIKEELYNGHTFEEVKNHLDSVSIKLPKILDPKERSWSLLQIFDIVKHSYATGVTNEFGMDEGSRFLYFDLAPRLMSFSLIEKVKIAGAKYEKVQTSKIGFKFLAQLELGKKQASSKKKISSK